MSQLPLQNSTEVFYSTLVRYTEIGAMKPTGTLVCPLTPA